MQYLLLSIINLLIFYAIYFGKLFLQKKQGIKTDQIGKGDKNKKLLIQEVIMKISTYLVVLVEIISIVFNWTMLSNVVRIVGVVVSMFGDIIFFLAVYTMKDSWRAGVTNDQTKLVTNGIYKISRNPAFLGFYLLYIGILLTYFSFQLLIITIFGIIMLHLQILEEEKHLQVAFGNDYVNYKRKVFRYFGRKLTNKK